MKTGENIRGVGEILGDGIQSVGTTGRSVSNLGIKGGLAIQAGIIDKYTGILPESVGEITSEAADFIAENVGKVLEINSDIPGLYDMLRTIPNFEEVAHDLENIGNIGGYMAALLIVYWFSRIVLQGKKGRFEATTSAVVWTALSAGIFKEMSDVLNGYGHDIMRWLPLAFFEQFPESIRETMLDADGRRNIYAGTLGVTGAGTSYFAIKNYVKMILGPKKKKRSKSQ